jgi:hypothetical protein
MAMPIIATNGPPNAAEKPKILAARRKFAAE